MKMNSFAEKLEHETKAALGEETKDTRFSSKNTFPNESAALEAFDRSIDKLFRVNDWSTLSIFTADFALHDQEGNPKFTPLPAAGDYILISLPGPMPENWVQVVYVVRKPNRVEFTVRPSSDPRNKKATAIEHFFDQNASSTFRVERRGTTIIASEIGKNEAINNQGPQAGDRAIVNTLIAESGWLFYQKIQWEQLTDYLVHR